MTTKTTLISLIAKALVLVSLLSISAQAHAEKTSKEKLTNPVVRPVLM
ncbi:MAG: hypothetical protein ACOYOK_09290 [Pseudobdellovibrionaceae bacterium]